MEFAKIGPLKYRDNVKLTKSSSEHDIGIVFILTFTTESRFSFIQWSL